MNRVTAATFIIVRPSKEILMQLRDADSKRYQNSWCFPGGTVEPDEDEIKTIIREIKEEYELDMDAEDCKELMIHDLSYGVSAKVFVCTPDADQNPVLHEGADMKWMKLDEIKKLQLGFEQEKIIPKLEEFLRDNH
ncbi:MAG: NUDIX domain-containing protein [Bacteroidetes bacterium]|nr:MAG: NUDIX domain-containing protein [Bacteroidota bacterium]